MEDVLICMLFLHAICMLFMDCLEYSPGRCPPTPFSPLRPSLRCWGLQAPEGKPWTGSPCTTALSAQGLQGWGACHEPCGREARARREPGAGGAPY